MTATAVRIPGWRIRLADLNNRLFGPDHTGADDTWAAELRAALTDTPGRHRVDDAPTLILRRPVAAIAAEPEYEVDQLGPWKPWEHEIQPAVIWREMTEVPR